MTTLWTIGTSRRVGFTPAEVDRLLDQLRLLQEGSYGDPACMATLTTLRAEMEYFIDALNSNYIGTDRRLPGTTQRTPEEYIGGGWLTQAEYTDLEQLMRDYNVLNERCSRRYGGQVIGLHLAPSWQGEPDDFDPGEEEDPELPPLSVPSLPSGGGLSTGAKVGIGLALASGALLLGTVLLKGKGR
jgi:hypothetical protein